VLLSARPESRLRSEDIADKVRGISLPIFRLQFFVVDVGITFQGRVSFRLVLRTSGRRTWMVKITPHFVPDLQDDIQRALNDWLSSLSSEEAERMAICVSGMEYSPKEIVREVEGKTRFGQEFINGLCSLHFSMVESDPDTSVVDLIRMSVGSTDEIPVVHFTARKPSNVRELNPVAHEIGSAARIIWRKLEKRSGLSNRELYSELGIHSPLFEWAIGWLAKT
jgi:hypothetical protein